VRECKRQNEKCKIEDEERLCSFLHFAFFIFTFAFLKGYDAFPVGSRPGLAVATDLTRQFHQNYCPFLPEVYYLD
jgi:hypothetical protein